MTDRTRQNPESGKRGRVVILVAPSGAGKSTMAKRLMTAFEDLRFSVSATTREPREGEQDGVDYHFLSPEEFQRRIDRGAFLEWEEFYNGKRYGTLRSAVDAELEQGKSVLFDVEIYGAWNIKQAYGEEALAIFIEPPSRQELRKRLEKRGTDSDEMIETRMKRVEEELSWSNRFDLTVVNDDLETAWKEIQKAVESHLA